MVIHAPIAGATSPVTMAGTMALANAESLAGITLSQLISDGTPVVYGGAITGFDMRAEENRKLDEVLEEAHKELATVAN